MQEQYEGEDSDFCPLTTAEIAALLHEARAATLSETGHTLARTLARIQARLGCGIVGPVAQRKEVLDDLFERWTYMDGPIDEWFVRQFDLLVNGGAVCETDAPEIVGLYRALARNYELGDPVVFTDGYGNERVGTVVSLEFAGKPGMLGIDADAEHGTFGRRPDEVRPLEEQEGHDDFSRGA